MVWLAMTTGARRGELAALRWHHLDLAAGVLTLRHSAYLNEHGQLQRRTPRLTSSGEWRSTRKRSR
ncbi:site-specific integrase [Micromonospora chalcea]|uniref:hypothetical protein n=1 Tax=Micromonospora chalcea TaxID=1874 RepID=UPI00223B7E82|nr:hypothetical protein [Micromonospora chalcea]